MAARIGSSTVASAVSPISRLFISTARTTAITVSSTPIDRVPMPSHIGSSVARAIADPGERQHEADEGAEVLEQHDRAARGSSTGG